MTDFWSGTPVPAKNFLLEDPNETDESSEPAGDPDQSINGLRNGSSD